MPSITVSMDRATVGRLSASGHFLYGFKAVRSSDKAARPLVWFRTTDYSLTTKLEWEPGGYGAYTSFNEIQPNQEIDVADQSSIALGQIAFVGNNAIITRVGAEGVASALSFESSAPRRLTCGILEASSFHVAPSSYCAFPLLGAGSFQVITPVEKVLLMFSTDRIDPGTAIVRLIDARPGIRSTNTKASASPGQLIDLRDAEEVDVSFNALEGWKGPGQPVSPSQDLAALLIESPR